MKTKRFFALALTVIMMFSLLPHAFAAEDITAMLAEYQKQAQAMQQEVIAQQEAARQDLALAQQQATQQVQQVQADMQKAYKQATCKHEWKRTYTEDKDETDGVHDEVTVCIDCEKELERVTVEDEKEQTATLRTALKAAPALRASDDPLAELKAAIENGGSYTLTQNITGIEEDIEVTKDVTLDLNGFSLSFAGNGHILATSGKLTITGNGTINRLYVNGGSAEVFGGTVAGLEVASGDVTIYGGTIRHLGGHGGSVTWYGGKVVYKNFDATLFYGVTAMANPPEGGTVTFTPAIAESGTSYPIKVTPANGYEFVQWSSNESVSFANPSSAETTFTINSAPSEPVTVTATFKEIVKPTLTITANPQTYVYNGKIQGPGDIAYDDPIIIAELFTVDGLLEGDELTSIVLDGQGQGIGTYDLEPSNASIKDAGGNTVTDNYDIQYVNGKLTIEAPSYTLSVTAPTFEAVTEDYTQPAAKEITINSTGNSNATISSVTVDSTNFTITNGVTTVQAGGTNETYKIQPKEGLASGTYTATITVTYDGGATATAKVSFTVNALDAVATPTFDPAAKEYKEAQNVTISCATEGATIYYTTDGAAPTTSSTLYTAPITVSTDTTIKAIAVKDGMKNSDVATAAYTITPEYTVSTAVSPDNSGTVTADKAAAKEGETVTLTATPAEGYEFTSWEITPSGVAVGEDGKFTMPAEKVTLTATFKLKTFTIKFVNDDGTELQSVTVAYGKTPAYTGETPEKPADTDYTYTFRGWDPAIASVTGEATYKATYTATKNEYTFTYEWAKDNSTVTAVRTCSNNPTLNLSETVKTTSEGTAATCEAAGKVTYTAEFTNAAFEKQTKTVETPALGHKWKVSEELWAGDYSSVTVTFVCENDATHTKKETAASSESISGSVVTYTAAITLDGQKFPFSKSVDIAGQGYVFTHTTQIWVKGSREGATFRVTRLGDDRWTYRLFTGIRVDGAPVSAYSKAPGSIILTLHPDYLESLSVGYHTLAVYFTDGEATADFLILPAGGSYYNNSTSERYTYVPPSNVPRTGDESNIALWGVLAAVSLAGALLIIRRKKA